MRASLLHGVCAQQLNKAMDVLGAVALGALAKADGFRELAFFDPAYHRVLQMGTNFRTSRRRRKPVWGRTWFWLVIDMTVS